MWQVQRGLIQSHGVFAPAQVVSNDLYWSNVVLLCGFNGVAGSTGAPGMTDESSAAHGNATVSGSAQIDTSQSVFGGSALLLDGSGDYVTFPDSADWDFDTGAFTIEGRFRFAATPTNCILLTQWSGGWAFWFEAGKLVFKPGSGTDSTNYTWSPTLNQWFSIAIDRDASSVARIYVDGIMVSKTTGFTRNLTGSTAVLCVGSLAPAGFGNSYDLNGWVDELRITKGVARYASDGGYTVPAAAFPRA